MSQKIMTLVMGFTDNASSGISGVSKKLDNLGRVGGASSKQLESFGKVSKIASVGIVAMGAGMLSTSKSASDYNQTITRSLVAMDDASVSAEDLKLMVSNMSKEMRTASKQELATQLEEVAKAGYKGGDAMSVVEMAIKGATATGSDLDGTTGLLINTMSAFGIEAGKSASAMDVLVAAANESTLDLSDIGTAMSYVGASASTAGISLEEVGGAMALMSQNGLKASTIGTSLRTVIANFSDPASKASGLMKELGVNTHDASGQMLPLNDIVAQYSEATKGMSQQQKDANASLIAGKTGMNGWNVMTRDGGVALGEFTGKMGEAKGVTEEGYGVISNQQPFEKFKASVDNAKLALGENFLPMVTKVIDKITEMLQKFAEDKEFRQHVTNLLAIVATVLSVIGIIKTCIAIVRTAITIWEALSFVFSVVKGVAMLVAGAIGAISAPVWIVIGVILSAIGVFIALCGGWDNAIAKAKELGSAVLEWVKGAFDKVGAINLWNAGANIMNSLWDGLKSVWGSITSWFSGLKSMIKFNISGSMGMSSGGFAVDDAYPAFNGAGVRLAEGMGVGLSNPVSVSTNTRKPQSNVNGLNVGNEANPELNVTVVNTWDGEQVRTYVNKENQKDSNTLRGFRGKW